MHMIRMELYFSKWATQLGEHAVQFGKIFNTQAVLLKKLQVDVADCRIILNDFLLNVAFQRDFNIFITTSLQWIQFNMFGFSRRI